MPPPSINKARLALEIVPVSLSAEGLNNLLCTQCLVPLGVHQPDEAAPYRLLGTCPSCHGWTLVEIARDGSQARTAVLPSLGVDAGRPEFPDRYGFASTSGTARSQADSRRPVRP